MKKWVKKLANEKNLDRTFAETQDIVVKARHGFYRYRKKFKQQTEAKGRKQGRFHIKDKNLSTGERRD